ncbi:ESCRT-II complex subunit-domain-containing protein [Mrakia frigida]|uniref:ESCRT-II subunit protein VPS25 n=1 Tax=Mrakia frigida TaxID=29902 RepID=UPI003FCC0300
MSFSSMSAASSSQAYQPSSPSSSSFQPPAASSSSSLQPPSSMTSFTSPSTGYIFPPIWSFPPFFTQQPNPQTLLHQTSLWTSLLLSWARFHRVFNLNSEDPPDLMPEVCFNRRINRKLGKEFLRYLMGEMVKAGQAAPTTLPPSRNVKELPSSVTLYWLKPEEWASSIYEWVSNTGQTNSILTFYDLQSDTSTQFHDLPLPLLRLALAVLVKQGKAQVFRGTTGEDGQEEGEGVKFV